MHRFALVFAALLLGACNASEPASAAKSGLTAVGEKVQELRQTVPEQVAVAHDVAAGAVDAAKSTLVSVGETTLAVGQAAETALTGVGTTVLELTGKEPAAAR